jgi:hypothetical protein
MQRRVMPGMIRADDWDRWAGKALSEFRERWRGRSMKMCAKETGISENNASRWVNLGCQPSARNLKAFRLACERSGIEIPEDSNA